MSLLHRIAIDIQVKVNILYITQFFFGYKITDNSRIIKSFAYFPGFAFSFQSSLYVTSCKIHSETYFLVIAVGKFRSNIFSKPADFHYYLRFVMQFAAEIRDVKWLVVFERSRVRFHKNDRFCRVGTVKFLIMFGVVLTDSKDFHTSYLFEFSSLSLLNMTAR